MDMYDIGKQAAEKQANLAQMLGRLGTGMGTKLQNVGKWVGQKPIRRGLPLAGAGYVGGEGAVSALQGDKSLGQQWDQSITRGELEGRRPSAYAGRLLTRPASTLYGTMLPYPRPDVTWKTSPEAATSEITPNAAGEGFSRQVTRQQEAAIPYWLQIEQQNRRQAVEGLQKSRQQGLSGVESAIRGAGSRVDAADQRRQAAREQLERSYGQQGLPSALPQPEMTPAGARLQQYLDSLRGEVPGGQPTPAGEDTGGQPAPTGEDTSGYDDAVSDVMQGRYQKKKSPTGEDDAPAPSGGQQQGGNSVAGALAAAGLPIAGMMASRRQSPQDEQEERLREAMRLYRFG